MDEFGGYVKLLVVWQVFIGVVVDCFGKYCICQYWFWYFQVDEFCYFGVGFVVGGIVQFDMQWCSVEQVSGDIGEFVGFFVGV